MKILITGGTGWLGKKLVREYVTRGYDITVLSRNEYNQWKLKQLYPDIKCILHDIRRPLENREFYDVIIHCAALKHVNTGIEFPDEVVDTNINGTRNITNYSYYNAKHLIYISTDKAVDPENWYGHTKEKGEEIALGGMPNTTIIRFGNLFGSSGSLVEILIKKILVGDDNIKLSHPKSERFFLHYKEAIDLIDKAIKTKPKLLIGQYKAVNIVDLANWIFSNPKIEFVGLRPGEKLVEKLYDFEYDYYTESEIQELFSDTIKDEMGSWLS